MTTKKKWYIFSLVLIIYIVLQACLLILFKNPVAFSISMFPMIAVGWMLGLQFALFQGIAILIANTAIKFFVIGFGPPGKELLFFIFSTIIVMPLGILVGKLSDLSRMIKKQLLERDEADKEKALLEEELRQSQKMESIGRLAGGIAHDFNNMLGAITGYADLIAAYVENDNPKLEKYAHGIQNASKHAAELTANLLAFARKGQLQIKPVDIHEAIQNVIMLLQHTIDKRIVISRNLQALSHVVLADNAQLQNAVLNLAINARDAMTNGGLLSFATSDAIIDNAYCATRRYKIVPGNYVMLTVADSGTGMSEETRARAFEPFFTTKEKGKGTGLGLASVYGTTKSHGGFIEIESKTGAGTKVFLWLPTTHEPSRNSVARTTARNGKGNILLIDDEELVLDMTNECLEDMGYTVFPFSGSRNALEFYHKRHSEIDVVLLDLVMPEMGGYECIVHLKKVNPLAKVIVVSAYSDPQETERVLNAGIVEFVRKPFTTEILSGAVAKALDCKQILPLTEN